MRRRAVRLTWPSCPRVATGRQPRRRHPALRRRPQPSLRSSAKRLATFRRQGSGRTYLAANKRSWAADPWVYGSAGSDSQRRNRGPLANIRRIRGRGRAACGRSEEHTFELQSLISIPHAVFCLKKEKTTTYQQLLKNL